MTLLAPMMLIGTAAVSIPLALHFFYRARYRPTPWAAMRFLRLSIEQTSRRLKFQEWILLLLRMLVLALLAFALARPASTSLSGSGGGASVDAIFLIDTSASMTARDGDTTRMERARRAAHRVLEQLPVNSTVQIIEVSDHAQLLGPRSPGNFDQARTILDELKPTDRATDFLPGLEEAIAALDRGTLPNKEVYLFSDQQTLGWESQPEAVKATARELDGRSTVYLVRCGLDEPSNVALIDLVPRGGIPHTGKRVMFSALVRNSGTKSVRNLTVTLEVDGATPDREAQAIDEIGPGEIRAVPLSAKLDRAGPTILRAQVSSDDMPADDRLDTIIDVREQVRVLVIDGNPEPSEPAEAASFFLAHALRPVPESDWSAYHIQPRVIRPEEAAPALLTDFDVCVLVDVPLGPGGPTRPLSDGFLERLQRFVRDGGGLLIGLGPNVEPAAYNTRLFAGANGVALLPMPLGDRFEAPEDAPIHPGPDSVVLGSYLAGFGQAPLNQIELAEVYEAFSVTRPDAKPDLESESESETEIESEAGRVLMQYADGRPMILSRRVQAGEVVMVTTTLGLAWTDWPIGVRENSYLPFLHLTLSHLLQRSTAGFNRIAGEPIEWLPPDNQQEYTVVRPNGEEDPQGKPGGTADDWFALRYPNTDQAGIYRIVPSESGPTALFAVRPNVRESENLTNLSEEEIDGKLGFRPVHLNAEADLGAAAGNYRTRNEWTILALLALFALALGETFWAWFCGRPVG